MKLLILYRPKSESRRAIETFIHDFQSRYEEARLEIVDVDSRDGIATATLYDIMKYPAILALREDGSVLQVWEGDDLPLMDDVAYYAQSA